QHLVDFLRRVDEGDRLALKIHRLELRQQAVAEYLGGDTGAVGNEEDGSAILHGHLRIRRPPRVVQVRNCRSCLGDSRLGSATEVGRVGRGHSSKASASRSAAKKRRNGAHKGSSEASEEAARQDCHPADRPYRLTDALARPTILVNNYAIVLG